MQHRHPKRQLHERHESAERNSDQDDDKGMRGEHALSRATPDDMHGDNGDRESRGLFYRLYATLIAAYVGTVVRTWSATPYGGTSRPQNETPLLSTLLSNP